MPKLFYVNSYKGFTDENSKWLKPTKRKRKADEAGSEDDSEELWEESDGDEDEEEQVQLQQKGSKGPAKTEIKEVEGDEDDKDDSDEDMVDDYGALDDGSEDEAQEEDSDAEDVSDLFLITTSFSLWVFFKVTTCNWVKENKLSKSLNTRK